MKGCINEYCLLKFAFADINIKVQNTQLSKEIISGINYNYKLYSMCHPIQRSHDAVAHANLIYINTCKKSLICEYEESNLIVYGNDELIKNGTALYYIAYYLAECIQTRINSSLLIHAAAVYKDQNSYLLLGEKGAGKTTLAVYLCQKFNMSLIGNDLVRIVKKDNTLYTYEGSRWFDIRKSSVLANEYLKKLNIIFNSTTEEIGWNNKIRVNADKLKIKTHKDIALISKIYYIRIDPYQKYLVKKEWKGIQKNLILHENLGRYITGQTTPLQDDNGKYYGSLPIINLKKSLSVRDDITNFFINNKVFEVFGSSVENIADVIKEDIK